MADTIKMANLEHFALLAGISSGGWRPLLQDVVEVPSADTATYTIVRPETLRLLLFTRDADLRFDMNEAATADSMPLLENNYITLSVEQGDEINFWNTSGGPETVYVAELR